MIATLILAGASIAAVSLAYQVGFSRGEQYGLHARLSSLGSGFERDRAERRRMLRQFSARFNDAIVNPPPRRGLKPRPAWRRFLGLSAVLLVAVSLSSCEQLTGVRPAAKPCTRSYNDTIRIQADTVQGPIAVTIGGCK